MGILLSPAMYSTTLLFIGASLVMGDSALMSGGTQTGPASSTKVKLLCDGDGIAVCERGEYLLNGRLVTLLAWDNATSLNDRWPALDAQGEGHRVAVRVSQVKGDFTLPSNANFVILSLHLTNLIRFMNHAQDLSSLEELIVSDSPEFDASSLQQLGKLPSLVILQMAGTPLATLSNRKLKQVLKEMPALQYLDISFSNLHHLEANTFKGNSKLQTLNVAGNDLSFSLDGGLLQQLVHLNMSHCSMEQLQIESVPQETMQTNLSIVDLSHNHLMSLPASFMNIISESNVHLNISGNLWNKSYTLCSLYHLWDYATKHPDRIHGAQNLRSHFNPDEALKKCGWEECPATCSCDMGSKTVNCTSSDLKTVPYLGPSDAEILLLQNNTLFNMSGIESPVWCKLKTLIADGNKISSIIPPDTMGHCTCFDHDDLDEEKRNCLPQSLKKLSLMHNKIENFSQGDCELLYSLQELHLSDNKVEHLRSHVCSSLEHLEILFLDNNSISDLREQDVIPYPNLRKLNLAFNKIDILPYRIFEFVPKLRALNVSNNSLRTISAVTSFPETPFTFMVTNFPKELDLSSNKFEKINAVLSFKYIPKLEKLFMYNNPWECYCETVNSVMARVFRDLQHTAMVNAVESVICQVPSEVRGMKMNDLEISKGCKQKCSESTSELFIPTVAILILVILVGLLVRVTFEKIKRGPFGMIWLPHPRIDATNRRTHSVCIVNALEDNEMVKEDLVDPLTELGYSVLWNDSPNFSGCIETTVTTSRRMIVVTSNNFVILYEKGKRFIERGLQEEISVPGFRVVAFVTDGPPQTPYEVLHEIVVNRDHITKMNRNYINEICRRLPPPNITLNITFTETDLYYFLLQLSENDKKKEQQQAPVQDIFSSQNSDPHANEEQVAKVEDSSQVNIEGYCTHF